jgi:hypothetical protein
MHGDRGSVPGAGNPACRADGFSRLTKTGLIHKLSAMKKIRGSNLAERSGTL